MSKLLRKHGKRSTAQAMVEFGLALPILLLVMYGLLESGRLLFIYASVVSAARQAVRYGSVTGDNAAGTPYYNDCAGIKAAAKSLGFIQRFNDSDIHIKYDNGPDATTPWTQLNCPIASNEHPVNGDRIYVSVSTQYSPIVPLVPFKPFTIASAGWRTLLVGVHIAVQVPGAPPPTGSGGTLSLVKDAWCLDCNPPGPYFERAGNTIRYTFTITNTGAGAIHVTQLTDQIEGSPEITVPIPAGFPDPLPGGNTSAQVTLTYITTANDVSPAAKIINLARVEGISIVNGSPSVATASRTINFVPKPQLTLTKDGALRNGDYVVRGAHLDYHFNLTNTGNVPLTPPYTIIDPNVGTSWSCPPTPLPPDSTPTVPGTVVQCTGTHILTGSDISARVVNNTATATAFYNSFTVTSNQASFQVPVPALLLVMSSCNTLDPSTQLCPTSVTAATVTQLNQTIYYEYTLTNRTGTSMSTLNITDSRGATNYLCLTSLPAVWAWPIGSNTKSCVRPYNAYTQADMDNPLGQFLNTGSALASGGKPSNTATAAVNVTQTPSFTLGKSGPMPAVVVSTLGAPVIYTYTFTNTGNVTLTAPFAVADDKILQGLGNCSALAGPLTVSGVGHILTCTRTYTVTQADLDAGSIINHATASATFNGVVAGVTAVHTIPSTGAPATAMVFTYDGPRVSALITANPAFYNSSPQDIMYTYAVRNTGNVNLGPPYTIADSDLAVPAMICPSTTNPLLPSAAVTCGTYKYTTSIGDMSLEFLQRTATATAMNGASVLTATNTLKVPRFMCDAAHVTGPWTPAVPPLTSDIILNLTNTSGQDIHIASLTISWSSGPPYLTNVYWNTVQKWSGLSPSSSGFYVPIDVGGFLLTNGGPAIPLEMKLTGAPAWTNVQATFVENGCSVVNWKLGP